MYRRYPNTQIGIPVGGPTAGTGALALNASGAWSALSYITYQSRTVTGMVCIVSAISGSPSLADLRCDIYSDNPGLGPLSLISSSSATTGTLTAGSLVSFTFSQSLTAGTTYWFVLKNLNSTPTTNTISIRVSNSFLLMSHLQLGSSAALPFSKRQTADGGSTWTTLPVAGVACFRWDFSDGTSDGFPISAASNPSGANRAFGVGELGNRFRTPKNAKMRVRSVVMPVSRAGTGPTSGVVAKLYQGTTLLGTSLTTQNAIVSSSTSSVPFLFGTTVTLEGDTVYRLAFAAASADGTSSNAWTTIEIGYLDNSAATLSCFPLEAMWSRFDGTNWTDDDTRFIPFLIYLDPDVDFDAAASGGGIASAFNKGLN